MSPPGLMRAALEHAEVGWCVFPLHPHSKTPAIRRWEHQATTEESRIRHWWAADSRNNIGLACGPSGLVVLDLDTGTTPPCDGAEPEHGRDVLARLAAEAGQPVPQHTYTVHTPSGGLHLYFRAPPGPVLRNTQGRLGRYLDTRAHGGFVVAAGSTRPEGTYRCHTDAPVAPLPEWLTEALLPAAPPPPCEPDSELAPLSPTRARAYLATVADRVAAAEVGTRHDTLLRAAYSLGRLAAGGELDQNQARAALHVAAARFGHDFATREAARAITDGLVHGARFPRRLDIPRPTEPP